MTLKCKPSCTQETLSNGFKEITVPTHFSTCKFTAYLPAAFLIRHKLSVLLWADLSMYSKQFLGCDHLTSKEYWEEICHLYAILENNSQPLWKWGKGTEKNGRWNSLILTFSLYSGPGLCEQNQEESSVTQKADINAEKGICGNWKSDLPVREVFSQAHAYVCTSCKHAGPAASVSTAYPSPTTTAHWE